MSPQTIAGSPVDIRVHEVPGGGWMAWGRILGDVKSPMDLVEARGPSRDEAESQCRERLERLIHVRVGGAE